MVAMDAAPNRCGLRVVVGRLVIVGVVYLLIGSIALTFNCYVIGPELGTASGAL